MKKGDKTQEQPPVHVRVTLEEAKNMVEYLSNLPYKSVYQAIDYLRSRIKEAETIQKLQKQAEEAQGQPGKKEAYPDG